MHICIRGKKERIKKNSTGKKKKVVDAFANRCAPALRKKTRRSREVKGSPQRGGAADRFSYAREKKG